MKVNVIKLNEKAIIPTVTISEDKSLNHYASTNSNNVTQDKIFLLSTDEANQYFNSEDERVCIPSQYAIFKGVDIDKNSGSCWWWLRTSGYDSDCISCVNPDGTVNAYGFNVRYENYAVRPAMWIDLSKV